MSEHVAAGPAPQPVLRNGPATRQSEVPPPSMVGVPVAALQLQRLAGNAAVARLIAGTTGATGSAAGRNARATVAAFGLQAPTGPDGQSSHQSPSQATPPHLRPSVTVNGHESQQAAAAIVQRGILDDVAGGLASIAGGARDSVLQTIAGWARRMPGYELLCTILGRDVVAGTPGAQDRRRRSSTDSSG